MQPARLLAAGPDLKHLTRLQKHKEEDGSITFTFPKGYRFKGGIEDAPPENDAEDTKNLVRWPLRPGFCSRSGWRAGVLPCRVAS